MRAITFFSAVAVYQVLGKNQYRQFLNNYIEFNSPTSPAFIFITKSLSGGIGNNCNKIRMGNEAHDYSCLFGSPVYIFNYKYLQSAVRQSHLIYYCYNQKAPDKLSDFTN